MKSREHIKSKQHTIPIQADIDYLVSFLPKLRSLEGKYTMIRDVGIEKGSDGVLTLVYPEYAPTVIEFFDAAAKPCWSDYDYEPEKAARMFGSAKLVKNASINQIRTILTWCVRGERFCDGHWAAVLSDGRIFHLLERLKKIGTDLGIRNLRCEFTGERWSFNKSILLKPFRICGG